jgi:negative regulator of replication initiation
MIRVAKWLEDSGTSRAIVEVDECSYLVDTSGIQPLGESDSQDINRLEAPLWLAELIREEAHLSGVMVEMSAIAAERHQNNLQAFKRLLLSDPIARNIYELYERQDGEEAYLAIVLALAEDNLRLQTQVIGILTGSSPVISQGYFAGGHSGEVSL